jgi:hypothetical protein
MNPVPSTKGGRFVDGRLVAVPPFVETQNTLTLIRPSYHDDLNLSTVTGSPFPASPSAAYVRLIQRLFQSLLLESLFHSILA